MNVQRTFAIAAIGTAMALAPPAPGWAAPTPPAAPANLSGHYVATESDTVSGQTTAHDWFFTSCGDGCAQVALNASTNPPVRAQVVNGQWTMDATMDWVCPDKSQVPSGFTAHYVWDPTTLAGTAQKTVKAGSCGSPTANTSSVNLQLKSG